MVFTYANPASGDRGVRQANSDKDLSATNSQASRAASSAGVQYVDPKVVFLARAAARERLALAGEMDIDEAIDGLAAAFENLFPCICNREMFERMMAGPAPRSRKSA